MISITKKIFASMLVLMLFIFTSCDIEPQKDVKLYVDINNIETLVSFSFMNPATNSQIGFDDPELQTNDDTRINVTVMGENADLVKDMFGDDKTEFSTTDGIISFSIDAATLPTPNNPVELLIKAESDDYLTTTKRITLTKSGGHGYSINMVEKDNVPNGVVSGEDTGMANANGVVEEEIVIELLEPQTGATASMTIPAGTRILDPNGEPLAGILRGRVTYLNNKSEESLNSFPGGFDVSVDTTIAVGKAEPVRGQFVTGGFGAFEITDNTGKEAKFFEFATKEPVEITMGIPSDTYNPETGATVQPGDVIPVWSYNEDTGEWKLETWNGLVEATGNPDAYLVRYNPEHLSWWNLDWFLSDYCFEGVSIRVTGSFISLRLRVLIDFGDGNYIYAGSSGYVTPGDPVVNLINVPEGYSARIQAIVDTQTGVEVWGEVDVPDLCNSSEIVELQVEEPGQQGASYHDIELNVYGYCANNPDINALPDIPIWVRGENYGNMFVFVGMMQDGYIVFPNMILNRTYWFGTEWDGEWYQEPYPIDKTNYDYNLEIPEEYCD